MCKRGYKGWEMPNCPPNGTGCGNGGDVSVCDAMTMVMTVAMVITMMITLVVVGKVLASERIAG